MVSGSDWGRWMLMVLVITHNNAGFPIPGQYDSVDWRRDLRIRLARARAAMVKMEKLVGDLVFE